MRYQNWDYIIPVSSEKTYAASCWVYDNDEDGVVNLHVYWYKGTVLYDSVTVSSSGSNPSNWRQLTLTNLVPEAGVDGAKYEIRFADCFPWDGNATVYLDDAIFDDENSTPEFSGINYGYLALTTVFAITITMVVRSKLRLK